MGDHIHVSRAVTGGSGQNKPKRGGGEKRMFCGGMLKGRGGVRNRPRVSTVESPGLETRTKKQIVKDWVLTSYRQIEAARGLHIPSSSQLGEVQQFFWGVRREKKSPPRNSLEKKQGEGKGT